MNRAKSLTIPRTQKQTSADKLFSLPVLIFSVCGVLNACSSEGVSQNEQFGSIESPELAVGPNAQVPVLNAASPEPEKESNPDTKTNIAPQILSFSLGCDLVTESVSIQTGDSAEFFLLVDDESPLDLAYAAEMLNPDIASVAVDSEGMLLVSGLTRGRTDLSVEVVDNEGLKDTIVIPVIVDL